MSRTEVIWKGNRAVTLKDVARAVGVSESLASTVLNGSKSGTRVSDETRAAVVAAAKEMGYRPNAVAKSLNTGRSNRIGIYSGRAQLDARNAFVSELLGGMFEGAREFEMNILVHTSGERDDLLLDLVSNRALDGLVFAPGRNDPIQSILGEFRIPAVAIADRIEGFPSICVDDRAGGKMQAEHLWELGHRHVLYRYPAQAPTSAIERLAGFQETAERLGLQVTVDEGEDAAAARGVTKRHVDVLTAEEGRATVLVGWNDATAEASWRTLLEHGVRVPEDVSIVGFDGFEWPYVRTDVLTSIHAPWAHVGRQAVRVLMDMVRGNPVPLLTTLPVSLIKGTTTFCFDKSAGSPSARPTEVIA